MPNNENQSAEDEGAQKTRIDGKGGGMKIGRRRMQRETVIFVAV